MFLKILLEIYTKQTTDRSIGNTLKNNSSGKFYNITLINWWVIATKIKNKDNLNYKD